MINIMNFLFVSVHLLISIFYCSSTAAPKVKISNGIISGTTYETVFGREVYAFFGVPYADPPIGENRFEFPKPKKPWTGEWNATRKPSVCLQYDISYSAHGEEDCLYLNIYTPKLPDNGAESSQLMDVIFYIHGGAFMFGNGQSFEPDYLLTENDLVFITIQYRLGPLGFLSTGDDIVPGNNGLKDQSMGLRWVQENIAKFGGNPSKVTIAGLSAGGASVHYHYLSPMSEGLFSQGICQSGTTLVPWALTEEMPEKSKRLANLVGCPSHCSKEMIECLKSRSATQILNNVEEFLPWRYNPFTSFGPTVETPGKNRFLSEEPIDIIRAGKVKNIPLIVSATKDEGLYPVAEYIDNDLINEIDKNWNYIAPHLFDYNYSVSYERRDEISKKIRDHFFKNEPIDSQHYQTLVKVAGDRLFTAYIEFTIREQIKVTSAPIYYYKFNYSGKYSVSMLFSKNNKTYGVSHGDDSFYVLKTDLANSHEVPADSEMIKFMVQMWTSFVHTGTPSVNNNFEWKPNSKYSLKDGLRSLEINYPHDAKMNYIRDTSVFDFWNTILKEFLVTKEHNEEL